MQDKLNIIEKANNIAIVCLFTSIFLKIFFPFFSCLTIISSCVIYISIVLRNRIIKGKFDFIQLILCSFSLIWVFLNEFLTSPYVNIFGLIIVYAFLTWSYKCNTGKWNRLVLVCGTITIISSIINIYIDSKVLSYITLGMQIYIIFKYIDPILEKIGLEHRRKRLEQEAMNKALNPINVIEKEVE